MASRLPLALICLLAFGLRVGLPYDAVLGGDYVAFFETDAWYHMRLVDSLLHHFPDRLWFDAYLRHPDGEAVHVGPLFDWLIAGTALVLGAGAPSDRLVNVVGAFTPAVLGALTTVPVYAIGRAAFSRPAGLVAALLFATMPGGTFRRSLLGYTDHHCAEMLLSAVMVMALVSSLTPPRSPFWHRYGGLTAGAALGAALLTWSGGVILVVILAGWAVLQIGLEHLRRLSGTDVQRVTTAMFATALLAIAPWIGTTRYFAYQAIALGVGLAGVAGLSWLARAMAGRRFGRILPLALPAGAAAVVAAGLVLAPERLLALVPELSRLSPFRTSYVAEATPLLMSPQWHPLPLWNEFTTATVLAVIALAVVASDAAIRPAAGHVLLVWWTLAMLAATVAQVRFTYYLGIPVAVLAGAACAWVVAGTASLWRRRERWSGAAGPARRPWLQAIVAGVLIAAIVGPSVPHLRAFGRLPPAPGADWIDTLTWMRVNTEEPFGDPATYYATRVTPPPAYGVLAWWDFGYWIIRLAHRVPIANPRQSGIGEVAAFLLAEDEASALAVLERTGARYVIADVLLQLVLSDRPGHVDGFFASVVTAAGRDPLQYGEIVFRRQGTGDPEPVLVYAPAYYRTMMTRLYSFQGRAAAPPGAVSVITTARETIDGKQYVVIAGEQTFPTYEAARAALGGDRSGDRRIVGWRPWETCVPLEALDTLQVVHRSVGRERRADGTPGPPVIQVFEYRPSR